MNKGGPVNIQTIPLSQINPAEYNPRIDLKPGDREYEQIRRSLEEFDCVVPLLWNKRSGNLVGGHQRLKVLIAQGRTEIEVSVVDLPMEKEKALNVTLNKAQGRWDEGKLAVLLDELCKVPDFDVKITGFDDVEIGRLLNGLEKSSSDELDAEQEAGKIIKPVTCRGDLIELGTHRLLCGDSASAEDVGRLMNGLKASMVNTDPPYNVSYYGGHRPRADARPKKCKQWEGIYFDDMPQEEYEQWLRGIFRNMANVLEEKGVVYVWNGHRQFGPMHRMLWDMGVLVSCVITWVKERFSIGYGDYNQQSEFCLYGWKEGEGKHRWYGPTNESTVWEVSRDDTKTYDHPTQKPVELATRAIRNSSRKGEIVLDLFLGSGSTLIASEGLNRRCFGLELDPRYCDVIVRRYIKFAGIGKVDSAVVEKYMEGKYEEKKKPE
jgi:DNA modification methylase